MSTPAFDSIEDRLTAYAFEELDEFQRADVEQLLAASPELRTELAELQSLAKLLRSELAAEAKPSLTPEQSQAVLLQASQPVTAATVAAEPLRRRRIRRWAIIGAEVAAGTAVAIGLANYWFGPDPASRAEPLAQRSTWHLDSPATGPEGLVRNDVRAPQSGEQARPDEKAKVASASLKAPTSSPSPLPSSPASREGESLSLSKSASPDRSKSDSRDRFATGVTPLSSAPVAGPPATHAPAAADPYFKESDDGLLAKDRLSSFGTAFRYREEPSNRLSDLPETTTHETYDAQPESTFVTPASQPLSTFSIDVDSASYTNVRRFLTQGQLPPADAVRIEELVNFFHYNYPQPRPGEPFSVTTDAAPCPWQPGNYLARIALQARTIDKAARPATNLVFLLDVSGSMQAANKLPLVKQAMTMLAEELNERDRIAIVTYAGDAGVKLTSTPGSDQVRIMQSIEALQAGGSTNGAAGINLAYEEAVRYFNGEGENRVILCTDGDFNVGVSSDDQLVQLIQQHARSKVFLSIFGFGMGNLKDAKLEKLADKGNGHYGYIDDMREARRVFSEELTGTLYTLAKDVKIQVEFNPLTVGAYRLIGYENRALAARDFNDDSKDAGEIGAGHTVTALYEIVPRGRWPQARAAEPLKYAEQSGQPVREPVVEAPKVNLPADAADDLFTVKLRYKPPTADASIKTVEYVVDDIAAKKIAPSADLMWAASVASFGMQLKNSQFKGQWSLDDLYEAAQAAKGVDVNGRRQEFLDLVQTARRLLPQTKRPATGF